MSLNVYKQSVYDHRSILINIFAIDDGSLNVKKYYKLINNISEQFQIIKVHSSTNDEDESTLKKIYVNFKKDYSILEKQWENFLLHHRAVGLMFIGEFKRGIEFQKLLKIYETEKDKSVGSVIESRLVLIYDESDEELVLAIKKSLVWHEDISSSSESEISKDNRFEQVDSKEEFNFIRDSLLQNDIIWYKRSLISGLDTDSSTSLTDSLSSNSSTPWKISSHNSDSSATSPYINAPSKSSISTETVNEGHLRDIDSQEFRAIYSFIKNIYEKLLASFLSRESTLTNKTEHAQARVNIMESSSDSGSTMSLEDIEFNLTDPTDLDRKKFQDEYRYNKTNKSRQYLGRLAKQTGDYAMLCGSYWQAYYYYQMSICYLKKYNNDQLWLAGAEEGLCCSWITYNFDTNLHYFNSEVVESLHQKCRQSFINQAKLNLNQATPNDVVSPQGSSPNVDQIDFSFLKKFGFPDLFKNPPEILSLDDLNDKYLASISRYKKALKEIKTEGLLSISLDSCIKASRFFIDRHRYLEASNFLKLIKSDLTLLDNDMEKYHNTLSKLYSQMGFIRKSMLHKYQTMVLLQMQLDNSNGTLMKRRISINNTSRQKIVDKKLIVIKEILTSLNINISSFFSEDVNVRCVHIINNVNDNQFEPIKLKMMLELFQMCKSLNYSVNSIVGLGLSLLDNWYMLIIKQDCHKLIEELNLLCKSEILKNGNRTKFCSVRNLPRLNKVIPSKLASYLLPKVLDKSTVAKSVFIYTPTTVNKRSIDKMPLESIIWVCGEECEIVLQFDNLLPIPLQLSAVQFLFHSYDHDVWVMAEGSSLHLLPCRSKNIHCNFVVIPISKLIPVGEYTITNISYQIMSFYNISFHPNNTVTDVVLLPVNIPSIKIYPVMPQMRVLTSLTDNSFTSFISLENNPPNTVLSSNITMYDNEILEFSVFLSNESKDLNIDTITCVLDELTLNNSSNMLISRISDDEYNNRRMSSHRMLSLVQENVMKNLSVKSLSSLKHSITTSSDYPSLPTDAVIKFRIDITEKEFCKEIFQKISSNKLLTELWNGQLRITFRYWRTQDFETSSERMSFNSEIDDIVVVRQEETDFENLFRESVYVLNCQVVLGLCVIDFKLEKNLDLILVLRNFTENKMNLDVYWKENKINLNYIVIVPNCGQIIQSNMEQKLKRVNSRECSSHIIVYKVNSDILDLKGMVENGTVHSEKDLTNYIQSNLKMLWTMKDKSLDKIRQGDVNLTLCLCKLGQQFSNSESINKPSIAHELSFTINDLIKIWMWNNVKLTIETFTQTNECHSPMSSTESDNDPITVQLMDCVQYRIECKFLEGCWANNISDEVINKIILKCSVSPTRIPHFSNCSSEEENMNYQYFELAGNTSLRFNRMSLGGSQLNGLVIFLIPGSYRVCSQLLISKEELLNDYNNTYDLLEESNICEVFVMK